MISKKLLFNKSIFLIVSCRMVVFSTCSWPSQPSYFVRKFHPPLMTVHPRPGSRHVAGTSVSGDNSRFVHSLLQYLRRVQDSDEPPAGIFWSKNQFIPISNSVSCARRRSGSYASVGIEGASHRMLLRKNSEPSFQTCASRPHAVGSVSTRNPPIFSIRVLHFRAAVDQLMFSVASTEMSFWSIFSVHVTDIF